MRREKTYSSGLTVSFLEGCTESIGFKKVRHVLPSPRASPKSPCLKVQFVDASNLEETWLTLIQNKCEQKVKQT